MKSLNSPVHLCGRESYNGRQERRLQDNKPSPDCTLLSVTLIIRCLWEGIHKCSYIPVMSLDWDFLTHLLRQDGSDTIAMGSTSFVYDTTTLDALPVSFSLLLNLVKSLVTAQRGGACTLRPFWWLLSKQLEGKKDSSRSLIPIKLLYNVAAWVPLVFTLNTKQHQEQQQLNYRYVISTNALVVSGISLPFAKTIP